MNLHTDDSFLLAIEAEPADRVRRLVYADWLDDRHDPRGELVRVEEEMRTLPVFADRFWELKPRRNELRALAGGDWCARMRYGTECEPVFRHGIPDGWRDRWRLIREFTERWHRIPMPDVGGRANEIAQAETRLQRELPPSLREWIAFAHDVNTIQEGKSELQSLSDRRLRVLPDNGMQSVFVIEPNYDYSINDRVISVLEDTHGHHRAIRNPDLSTPDPLAYAYSNRWSNDDYHLEFQEDISPHVLSECVLQLMLEQATGDQVYRERCLPRPESRSGRLAPTLPRTGAFRQT